MDSKYCYPETNVLINILNIKDNNTLSEAEKKYTAIRTKELLYQPVSGNFDLAHLQAIHKHLFQDIYDWAGEIRTVDIAKSNMFCLVQFIPSFSDEIFRNLKTENYLKGLTEDKFVKRCAYYFCEINALHPFREGNGRAQREFIRELALNAGYELHWSKVTEEEMLEASIHSFNVDNTKMEEILAKAITGKRAE